MAPLRRTMIVGQPGSGKSTLARALGQRTGLPVVHIDHIHWMPGWVERDRAGKTRLCHEVEARETWIFEGGHSATWANRLARAGLLIWLDLPLPLRFWRVIRRTLAWHGRNRPDLARGLPRRVSWRNPGLLALHLAHTAQRPAGAATAVGQRATGQAAHPPDLARRGAALSADRTLK